MFSLKRDTKRGRLYEHNYIYVLVQESESDTTEQLTLNTNIKSMLQTSVCVCWQMEMLRGTGYCYP